MRVVALSASALATLAAGGTLPAPASDLPVFAGIPGGMGRLPETLAAALPVRLGAVVRGLTRTPEGFALTVGPLLGVFLPMLELPARAAKKTPVNA